MKKMFLSLLIASLPLAMFGAAPFKLKLHREDPTSIMFSFTITSLYDGRLVVDYPNIVVNKGKAGCVIYDEKRTDENYNNIARANGKDPYLSSIGDKFMLMFSTTEGQKDFVRQYGIQEDRQLVFEYGDVRESLMMCDKNTILEIVIPTNVGTYTFKDK